MKKEPWNLGEGLPNVIESVENKLLAASYRLECGERQNTIINIDDYEHTVLFRALQEYKERKLNHE